MTLLQWTPNLQHAHDSLHVPMPDTCWPAVLFEPHFQISSPFFEHSPDHVSPPLLHCQAAVLFGRSIAISARECLLDDDIAFLLERVTSALRLVASLSSSYLSHIGNSSEHVDALSAEISPDTLLTNMTMLAEALVFLRLYCQSVLPALPADAARRFSGFLLAHSCEMIAAIQPLARLLDANVMSWITISLSHLTDCCAMCVTRALQLQAPEQTFACRSDAVWKFSAILGSLPHETQRRSVDIQSIRAMWCNIVEVVMLVLISWTLPDEGLWTCDLSSAGAGPPPAASLWLHLLHACRRIGDSVSSSPGDQVPSLLFWDVCNSACQKFVGASGAAPKNHENSLLSDELKIIWQGMA
jgi:hypothetical protein